MATLLRGWSSAAQVEACIGAGRGVGGGASTLVLSKAFGNFQHFGRLSAGYSHADYDTGTTMYVPPCAAIPRLIALLQAGYEIDRGTLTDVGDALWLRHPARKRTTQTVVYLYDTGLVVGTSVGDDDPPRFGPDADDAFRQYVAQIPKPTWWEQHSAPFYIAAAYLTMGLLGWMVVRAAGWVWDALMGAL